MKDKETLKPNRDGEKKLRTIEFFGRSVASHGKINDSMKKLDEAWHFFLPNYIQNPEGAKKSVKVLS